jgi:hypothetical protein
MEFEIRKKAQTAGILTAEEVKRRVLNWPDCYYKERDPVIRRMLLDEAESQNLTPEDNVFREQLFSKRYEGFHPARGAKADRYLALWMDMRYSGQGGTGSLFSRGNIRRIRKSMESIGYTKDLTHEQQNLLYQELYHLGMLYIALCQEDKGYSALFFGMGKISDTQLVHKIGAEFRLVASTALEVLGAEDTYPIWKSAITDAYLDAFPGYEDSLKMDE